MSSEPKRSKSEDKDANCRLRHGLNVHCLAHIFQFLKTKDLYTIGEMNDFYKGIINDLVISEHIVDFGQFYAKEIFYIKKMFERYGGSIRKFKYNYDQHRRIEQFIRCVTQYCSIDQLKTAEIQLSNSYGDSHIHLPIQFRKVDKFKFYVSFEGF